MGLLLPAMSCVKIIFWFYSDNYQSIKNRKINSNIYYDFDEYESSQKRKESLIVVKRIENQYICYLNDNK